MPPSVGPNAGPRITLMPKNSIALPRCSGGNTRNSVYIESGCSKPATAPCTIRLKISTDSLGLNPASTNAAMKTPRAPMKVLRWPKLRIIHAWSSMAIVIAARAPVESHCARFCPMPKVPMISGIATFTVVVVSTAEIVPSMTVPVASQR